MKVYRADELRTRPQEWLVEPYIPLNEVTLLTGTRRSGKGLFCIRLAAEVSNGLVMDQRMDDQNCTYPDQALWVTPSVSEDAAPEIVSRFVAADGDPTRLSIVVLERGQGARGLHPLLSTGAYLVVIDPLQAVLGDLSQPSARPRMEDLVHLARTSSSTIIAIRHVTKRGGGRGRGEIADVARSELIIGKHPDNEDLIVVAQAPSSYGEGDPVAYRLDYPEGTAAPRLVVVHEWDDDIMPIDLMPRPPRRRRTSRPPSRQEKAGRFLLEQLQSGPRPRTEILRLGRRRRHSERTIERAAQELGVRRELQREGGRFGSTWWSLDPRGQIWRTGSGPEDAVGADDV